MNLSTFFHKLRTRVLLNLKYLPQSRFRRCGCCLRSTLILSLSNGEEFKFCVRCKANLRYEMLAESLRQQFPNIRDLVVLELDPKSPLRELLSQAKVHLRTYFSQEDLKGSVKPDGSICEDITKLTVDSCSVDLIVSSDVLEHVPDVEAAFAETARVLKPSGCHLFTVPPRQRTKKRAEIVNGELKFLAEPEYHSDPLNPAGILAFWDFGTDAIDMFSASGLKVSIVNGPRGRDQRIVWKAEKPDR
jgi:SAM-dependent methyltransferase